MHKITLAVLAMLGIFGTDRWADGSNAGSPAAGMPSSSERLPPLDLKVPSQVVETATFALG